MALVVGAAAAGSAAGAAAAAAAARARSGAQSRQQPRLVLRSSSSQPRRRHVAAAAPDGERASSVSVASLSLSPPGSAAASRDGGGDSGSDAPPPGCSRYTVKLRRPLGLVLEQNGDPSSAPIVVADVRPESAAAKAGVGVGDTLVATSGVTYNRLEEYGGVAVRKDMQLVRVIARGQSFKTISAAIGSHPGHMEITLEFQRCE